MKKTRRVTVFNALFFFLFCMNILDPLLEPSEGECVLAKGACGKPGHLHAFLLVDFVCGSVCPVSAECLGVFSSDVLLHFGLQSSLPSRRVLC